MLVKLRNHHFHYDHDAQTYTTVWVRQPTGYASQEGRIDSAPAPWEKRWGKLAFTKEYLDWLPES